MVLGSAGYDCELFQQPEFSMMIKTYKNMLYRILRQVQYESSSCYTIANGQNQELRGYLWPCKGVAKPMEIGIRGVVGHAWFAGKACAPTPFPNSL